MGSTSVIDDLQVAFQKMQFHVESHNNLLLFWAKKVASGYDIVGNEAVAQAISRDLTAVLNAVTIFNSAAEMAQFSSFTPLLPAAGKTHTNVPLPAEFTESAKEEVVPNDEDPQPLYDFTKVEMNKGDSGRCILSTMVDNKEGICYITVSTDENTKLFHDLKANCEMNGQYQWTPPSNTIFGYHDPQDDLFFRAICVNNSRKFSATSIDIFLVDFGQYTTIDTHGPFYILSGDFSTLPGQARLASIGKVDGKLFSDHSRTVTELANEGPWVFTVMDITGDLVCVNLSTEVKSMSCSSNTSMDMSNVIEPPNDYMGSLIEPPNGFASEEEGAVGYTALDEGKSKLIGPPGIFNSKDYDKQDNLAVKENEKTNGIESLIDDDDDEEECHGTSNALKAVLGYVPRDDQNYCKFYDPVTKGCFKGGHCHKVHLPLDEQGFTQDTRPAKISIRKAPLPKVGAEIVGLVTCIVNPEICYIHLEINAVVQLFLMNDQITHLVKSGALKPINDQPQPLQKLDLVTAEYDGHWYRAQIVDFPTGKQYRVRYVDYGNTSVVSKKGMRQWCSEFDNLPYFAHRARIANVSTKKTKIIEATKFLQSAVIEGKTSDLKKIIMKVVSNNPEIEITMMDAQGFDIGQCMIAYELVDPRNV